MAIKLTIDGVTTTLPTDKPWSIVNAPDAVVTPPVTDLAAAIAAAKPGDVITLDENIAYSSKAIRVTVDDLTIYGNDARIAFDPEGQKDAALFVLDKVKGFAITDVTVSGPAKSDAASYVVRCEGAQNVFIERVKTVATPAGGMGIVFCRGVNRLEVFGCSTERTTVFSVYASGSSNVNKKIRILACKFGKTESHNTRFYGVEDLFIADCEMDNSESTSGRQCLKVHSGKNVTVQDCVFKGSIRAGRDVNDNPAYTLTNVLIERCTMFDWARVDEGANVRFKDCELAVKSSGFVFHLFDKTTLENVKATYPNGKFANNTQHIVGKVNCTFNGKPV